MFSDIIDKERLGKMIKLTEMEMLELVNHQTELRDHYAEFAARIIEHKILLESERPMPEPVHLCTPAEYAYRKKKCETFES